MRIITYETIENFKTYLTEDEKSENTIEKYVRDIMFFKNWIQEREITKMEVLAYKQNLCKKQAVTSVNSAISSINCFFNFMNWHDIRIKTLKIQKQIFTNKEKELTKSEYERLLMVAKNRRSQRLYYMLMTLCSSGIRVSELKFITKKSLESGKANINCKGKMRVVILPDDLCKILKRYVQTMGIKEGPLFVTKSGKPLDRSNIWKMLKSLCDEARVSKQKVFPHNFRHLFARTYYSIQKDIVRLADVLGHSSINTTRIYTIETGEIHRSQIQKLGLLRCCYYTT